MKTVFNFTFLLISFFCFSQYRINYILQLKYPDGNSKKFSMNLDIVNNDVQFYDSDLLNSGTLASKSNQLIVRNVGSNENSMVVFTPDKKSFQIKSKDVIAWNLTNEFKQQKDYKLQKATAKFGDREWTAWFTSNANINEGPYKFNGLPGLVVELYDSEKIFDYNLVSVSKLKDSDKKLSLNISGIPAITWEKYNKLLGDFFEDPYNTQRQSLSKGNELNINDKDVKVQHLPSQTKEFQNRMRLSFPPAIELDNFTFYKDKILNKL